MSSRLNFSQFWGSPFLSDISIQLHSPGDPHDTHLSLFGHAVVLCQASPLLRQLVEIEVDEDSALGSPTRDGVVASGTNTSPRKAAAATACGALGPGSKPRCARGVLRLPVEAADVAAAQLVLHGMYDPLVMAHPEVEARPELLVGVVRLADLLQVDSVLLAAAKALEGCTSWGRGVVAAVLELPLLSTGAVRALNTRARSELLAYFRDFDIAWATPELRGFFLQLPCDAVEWVLGHRDLVTTSENTPFCAATDWVECGRGVNAAPSQLASLLGALRLGALSPSFFHSQVLARPWVRVAVDVLATSPAASHTSRSSSGSGASSGHGSSSSSGGSSGSSGDSSVSIPSESGAQAGLGLVQLASLYAQANNPTMVEAASAVGALGTSHGLPHWLAAGPRETPLSPTCIMLQLPLHTLREQLEALGTGRAATVAPASTVHSAPNTSQPAGRLPVTGRSSRYSVPSSPSSRLSAYTLEGLGMVAPLNSTVVRTAASGGTQAGSSVSGVSEGVSVSSPNLVPSPTVVWGGYVWALDVFVARDPDLVLGASVHALYPAFGLPAVLPPPRIITHNIPLTPTASPARTASAANGEDGGASTNVSPIQPLPPLPSLPRIRGRHTFTGAEAIPGLPGASDAVSRSISSVHPPSTTNTSDASAAAAASTSRALSLGGTTSTRQATATTSLLHATPTRTITATSTTVVAPTMVPARTPVMHVPPPPPPPLTSARWAVQAEVRLSVWDAEVETWSPIYQQLLTSNTGLEQVTPSPSDIAGDGSGANDDRTVRSPTTPYHSGLYRVAYTDYYPVWGQHALRKLLYEPASWQRAAYAPDGRLLLRAELVKLR